MNKILKFLQSSLFLAQVVKTVFEGQMALFLGLVIAISTFNEVQSASKGKVSASRQSDMKCICKMHVSSMFSLSLCNETLASDKT